MARKSRKETAAVAVQEADTACRAAIYVRLSVEDNSISNRPVARMALIRCPILNVHQIAVDRQRAR